MKLIAAPLLIRVSRHARRPQLSQLPVVIINRLRTPRTIDHRISNRATVRCPHFAAVVELLIAVVMTRRTRSEGAGNSTKLRARMFSVAIDTTNPGRFMRLDRRGLK